MKVLHVISSIGPLRGGPSVVVRLLARGLTRRGIEVHICTTDDNGPGRSEVPLYQPVRRDDVSFFYFPRQSAFYTISLPLMQWLFRNAAAYDVIHVHAVFSFSSTVAAFIARARGVPYIIRPLGVLNEWGLRNRRPRLKQLSLHLIERRMFSAASLVHFTSEQERVEARKAGVNAPSIVIPNPVPATELIKTSKCEFRRMYPQLGGRRIILFLSRLDRKKGLELLLEAFAKLRPDNACLVIAGDGDQSYRKELEKIARESGIAADVHWTGFLSGADKAAALADAEVFVLPSYSENFGNAVVEALIAGVPVIVSDRVGICRELLERNAALVVPCDSNAISTAISRLLSSPEEAANLGIQGQRIARELFSEDSVMEMLLNCYRDVLARSAGGHSRPREAGTPALRSN